MTNIYAYMDGDKIISMSDGNKTVPMVYTDEKIARSMENFVRGFAELAHRPILLVEWNFSRAIMAIQP